MTLAQFFERHQEFLTRWGTSWNGEHRMIHIELGHPENSGSTSWIARFSPERIELAQASGDDGRADLDVWMHETDFLGMISGERDMLATARDASRSVRLSRLDPEAIDLFGRLMYRFAIAMQCNDRFKGSLIEQIYATGEVRDATGETFSIGTGPIPFCTGRSLHELIIERQLSRTLEIGMAHGLSTLFIAQALEDRGEGKHLALDPYQTDYFRSIGLLNVERAGLRPRVELMQKPDFEALPQLLAEGRRFDFAFLDGMHKFDYTLLDFFYVDLLLEPGGIMVFDDMHVPPVAKVVAYVLKNKAHYRHLPTVGNARIAVLEKLEETRIGLNFDQKNVFHDF